MVWKVEQRLTEVLFGRGTIGKGSCCRYRTMWIDGTILYVVDRRQMDEYRGTRQQDLLLGDVAQRTVACPVLMIARRSRYHDIVT